MKNYIYFLAVFCLFSFNHLHAQDSQVGKIVTIKGYKNANNKKVKDGIKAEVILDLPNIKLYRVFSASSVNVNQGGGNRGNVDVSDTFWYCKRPNEDVATIVSWTFRTQVNKNSIFRKNATEYFKDYPQLSKKIDDKELKHDDIVEVVTQYDTWKAGGN
ncbi:hypothetical protein [Moheibacter sediminis]|uniref:Uncharacterized protein n=1 Tax=Moheibacter sediminis TaxID=1434700 RepID=A0A1W2BCP7_9FLAO|nr:hypothetical protein [Moheibacter sediminis]SMC70591.1 hypothetical protein SAMN06296427_10659 [Moheibacter sediminis]